MITFFLDDKARAVNPQARGRRGHVPVAIVNDDKSVESRYQSLYQVVRASLFECVRLKSAMAAVFFAKRN